MNDSRCVRGIQCVEHLHDERDGDARRHRPVFVDDFFERAPVNKLEHDIRQPVRLANVERANDVFMRKVEHRARLTLKTAQEFRVVAIFVFEHLDGDDFTGTEVDRAVNMRHAAGSDEVYNAITMPDDGSLCNHSASPSSNRTRMTVILSVPPLSSAS